MSFRLNFPKEGMAESAALGRQDINKIAASELENKFKPLEMAVKAQNSLAYNSRSGNIGMFLRSIAQLPVAERQAYLSDPANRQHYMSMMQQFKDSMQQEQGQGGRGNALTSMIQNFDFQGQQQNPLQKIASMFGFGGDQQGQQQNQLMQPPQQQEMQHPQDVMTQDAIMQPKPPGQDQAPQEDKSVYYSQHLANQSSLTAPQKNRFESAAIFEDWLHSNKEEYSSRIANAAKYAGAMGRGKKYADMLRKEQPEAYSDYVWYHDTFAPSLVNQVKMMEHMASSNSQREELHGMIPSVDNLKSNPKATIKQINKAMKTMGDISNSVFKVSEPRWPGAYKNMQGWSDDKGDYIQNIPEEYTAGKTQSRTQALSEKPKVTDYATKRLASGIVMPKFETKEQGIAWFRRQPPQVQEAIRLHLGK